MYNTELNGWLNIDKPLGYSSAKVVAILKRIIKPRKIGHGGTLDPLASGVLPICINKATKTTNKTMEFVKEYIFDVTFGESRTTNDSEGEVNGTSDKIPSKDEIQQILPKFIGDIQQTPPIFSAIKVAGRRAYDLARNGESVVLKPREVKVYELKLLETVSNNTVKFYVKCGKGFYIRSLADDISKSLLTLGYVSYLRRISVGVFNQENILKIEDIEKLVKDNQLSDKLIQI